MLKNAYPSFLASFTMIELKKEYDQYGLKMILTGDWEQGSAGPVNYPAIEEAILDAKRKGIFPNFFYDARKLKYEMSASILSLIVIPRNIYGEYCPVTICAVDDKINDPKATWKSISQHGWRGIAKYIAGHEEASGKKILYFNYDEAIESYKKASEM